MNNSKDISEELIETVERYLNKSMDKTELQDFEKKLEDSNFRTLVNDIKEIILGIETYELKEQLNEFHKEIDAKPKTYITSKLRFLHLKRIAVAAVLIISLGSLWYFTSNTNTRLYNKYFTPDPGLPTTMSSTSNFDFYDAMVNYKHGDYNVAISKWKTLAEKKPNNDTLNYFLGAAYLAIKKETQAIPFLEKTVQSKTDFYLKNDAYYYLGLAYLKEGNVELAIKYLELSKKEVSTEILSKLKK
ncbi:tol-pal system YbgF family protein [Seonamhaeicola sp.]|uniref:tetratricopeptide repeat protein n=1 Tax=Seonamhaeicola sp. TaxID=1912245 RepID=UPI003561EAFC